MIGVLYGKSAGPWVDPVVTDMQVVADDRGQEIAALSIETVTRSLREWQSVERLYVLPFDVPATAPPDLPRAAPDLVRALFPRAEIINPLAAHELCWDKPAAARRLLERGVPVPETLMTSDPAEAMSFIRHHQHAILKEPYGGGGHGHVIVAADDTGAIAGEIPGRRYAVELQESGSERRVHHGVLSYPPPFFLQRLVTDVGRAGVLRPAQILRAYVVDGQIAFWSERVRDKIRRPADFIISTTFGARYRLLRTASDAAATVARRAAEALGVRIGVVDLIRASDQGPYVLEVDTDGYHMLIDRSFTQLPEWREVYDFDRMIAEALLEPPAEVRTRALGHEAEARRARRPAPPRRHPRGG
ncbi:MAG: hypothetical protein AB7V27_00055 [Candidatus Binatia bacterium]